MWLVDIETWKALQAAYAAGFAPSAEAQEKYLARFDGESRDESGSRLLVRAGDCAEIRINGLMTNARSMFAFMFGGGNITYSEIISAIAEAENDDNIKSITFVIDSPGGEFAGMFDAVDAIKAMVKPTKTIVSNMAASAAFALASQTDEIIANNRATQIGSVGIAAMFRTFDFEVTVTSSEAPKKRPDVTTPEGQEIVREQLDAMHELFAEAIADGRNTTVKKVNKNFGQGATLLADAALERGMIDSIAAKPVSLSAISDEFDDEQPTASNTMDLEELQAKYPALCASILKTGVEQGTADERDRVSAHLIMGESSGDMKTAIAAIDEGSAMTAALQAKYMAAGMARKNIGDREADDDDAEGADDVDTTPEAAEAETQLEAVAAKVGELMGAPVQAVA